MVCVRTYLIADCTRHCHNSSFFLEVYLLLLNSGKMSWDWKQRVADLTKGWFMFMV